MAFNNRDTTGEAVTYQDEVVETSEEIERKLAATKFKELFDKLSASHGHNNFPKNGEFEGLKFYGLGVDRGIHVCDCSIDGDGSNHSLILYYDEKNNLFNLKKLDSGEEVSWNNISPREAINFLNQISDKIEERENHRQHIVNKTGDAIKAAMTIFEDKKPGRLGNIFKK